MSVTMVTINENLNTAHSGIFATAFKEELKTNNIHIQKKEGHILNLNVLSVHHSNINADWMNDGIECTCSQNSSDIKIKVPSHPNRNEVESTAVNAAKKWLKLNS